MLYPGENQAREIKDLSGEWGSDTFWGQIDEVRISEAVPSEPNCGFEGYLDGDINYDCYVDLEDLKELVNNWLE